MHQRSTPRGFTIVEMLAVVGIIALLLAILLPALSSAQKNARWAKSQTNLRSVGQLLELYIQDNRDIIAPTAFDYAPNNSTTEIDRAGKVRSPSPVGATPPIGELYAGTWSDILWSTAKPAFGPVLNISESASPWDYRFDSPDAALYSSGWLGPNPFRSEEELQKPAGGDGATPFGTGALTSERGDPGYFGGNPFFDGRAATVARPNSGKFWARGQIKRPSASMYLTDSNLGELLEVNNTNWDPTNPNLDLVGVEWRYTGKNCIMLMLDGHVETRGQWDNLKDLELELGVRVLGLDQNVFFQ